MSNPQHSSFSCFGHSYSPEEIALIAVGAAVEKKASRPVVMDLTNLNVLTEYFAIVSASNSRQVYAIADSIKVFFKQTFGLKPLSVDGLETSTWILLDYGFLFVHVFQDSTREKYNLEQLWSKSRFIDLSKEQHLSLFQTLQSNLEKNQLEANNASQPLDSI